ncbi:hypothetical protein V8C86DRAFT_3024172 [Haematococcus lacustris]
MGRERDAGSRGQVDGAATLLERIQEEKRRKLGGPRTVLPGEDEEDLDERSFTRQDRGPIKDVDPSTAANRRAAQRAEHRRRTAIMDVSIVPSELAAAEEDYDEPEEQFLSGDIPLEPFHLKREREEGFFDAAGNYVRYRVDEVRDAWLDTLDQEEPLLRVEGELATRLLALTQAQHRAAAGTAGTGQGRKAAGAEGGVGSRKVATKKRGTALAGTKHKAEGEEEEEGEGEEEEEEEKEEEEEEEPAMGEEQMSLLKGRLAALLLPGENTLEGLRRLGRQPGQPAAPSPSPSRRLPAARQDPGLTGAVVDIDLGSTDPTASGPGAMSDPHLALGGGGEDAGDGVTGVQGEGDEATGLHYSSSLGLWYDRAHELFMDANTAGNHGGEGVWQCLCQAKVDQDHLKHRTLHVSALQATLQWFPTSASKSGVTDKRTFSHINGSRSSGSRSVQAAMKEFCCHCQVCMHQGMYNNTFPLPTSTAMSICQERGRSQAVQA